GTPGMTSPGSSGGNSTGINLGGLTTGVAGAYGYGNNYGATTVEGSYLSGAAAFAAGLGQYNLDTSRAAKYFEDANRQAIENHLFAIQTAYEVQRLNKAHWLADHPRLTPEQAAQINQSRLPRRLSASELDPTWGAIRWPDVLEQPEFEASRRQFDDLFAHRADDRPGVGTSFHRRAQTFARDMRATLDEERDSLSQIEWIQAMRFIESLAYEARFANESVAGKYTAN
ncbi:MAG TPA: hypothetical protein VKB78_16830, partial [Pirellulales bacterium]|nr:hypothetical protein [Pirellulales bacterium]